ncbi:MAG TPA: DedA family protein [Bacteroidota bacterium]|nr:DedA family protein [Bacteroidota bacterium]
MENFVNNLALLDPFWVYLTIAGIAYIENIFPPFPSDVVVIAAGSLVGIGTINFGLALLLATAGSTLGFMTMYKVGDWFGAKILEKGKIKVIPIDGVHKVEAWFRKYGYWVVVVNRFMAGTRAVVAFFVGMSELSLLKSAVLSFVSALAWNFLLLYAGKALGQNWRSIIIYLQAYGQTITIVVIAVIIGIIAHQLYSRRTGNSAQTPSSLS